MLNKSAHPHPVYREATPQSWRCPLSAPVRLSQHLPEQRTHPDGEKLLAVLRPCNPEVATALGLVEGATVIHLRMLRRIEGVPVSVINHYLTDASGWPLLQQFSGGSLHQFMQQEMGMVLNHDQTRIAVRRAQAKESRLLEVSLHSPLLCVRTLNRCASNATLAEYSVSLTRADMIELTVEN